jgi:molecular chaperone HtpG
MSELTDTPLYRYLNARDTSYAGRAVDLRNAVAGWLEYIPTTFPHYTRHTLGHSEAVIRQLSDLIFIENDDERATIELSGVEAYVLIAAALLHDAGMVCSESDKAAILQSADWAQWIAASPGRVDQLAALDDFRDGDSPSDPQLRNLLADYGLRQMIAEFVRRTHHARVVPILKEHEADFAGFAFGDPSLLRTIAAVCESHGLSSNELDDSQKFPDRRTVRDELVNVRLMTLLLRIADLLDVSPERACPLVQSAAAPLPVESVAHWGQYKRFCHRLTAPDRIELEAECETADEHRLVRDWCQWIVDEVAGAHTLMAGAHRHAGWKPPIARMDGNSATITVKAAPGAAYIPSDWTFELDPIEVINRLVTDVSPAPLFFVRELIQNALDATRCRISDLVPERSGTRPEDIRGVDVALRAAHPVRVELSMATRCDPVGRGSEEVQELSIEDRGTGMSQQIIERYFLQVGRSYYTTPNFRTQYQFAPTSRFGVGFLSVFRASSHVTVQTATAADMETKSGGLSLTLTGPRTYILTETGDRTRPGTRITVRLAEPLDQDALTEMVRELCRRVEVPILVSDLGHEATIEPERPEDLCWERPIPDTNGDVVGVRSYPINTEGISGELFVIYRTREEAEDWSIASWAKNAYIIEHPGDPLPDLPTGATFLNGLSTGGMKAFNPLRLRLDYRRPAPSLGLQRASLAPIMTDIDKDPGVAAALTAILDEHLRETPLSQGDDGWRYLHRMADAFPLKAYWQERDGVVPVHRGARPEFLSMRAVREQPTITTIQYVGQYADLRQNRNLEERAISWETFELSEDDLAMVDWHLNRFGKDVTNEVFAGRWICNLRASPDKYLMIRWASREQAPGERTAIRLQDKPFYLATLDDDETIGFKRGCVR